MLVSVLFCHVVKWYELEFLLGWKDELIPGAAIVIPILVISQTRLVIQNAVNQDKSSPPEVLEIFLWILAVITQVYIIPM